MRFLVLAAVLWVAAASSYARTGTNAVGTGTCEDGRQWFISIEVDENGEPSCYQGLTCDGIMYNRSKTEIETTANETPHSEIRVLPGQIEVTMNNFDGNVSVHDVFTGKMIHDFGAVPAQNLTSSQVRPGRYIVVTRDPLTGKVTDSDLILVE